MRGLPSLSQINSPAQAGVVGKLSEGALDPLMWWFYLARQLNLTTTALSLSLFRRGEEEEKERKNSQVDTMIFYLKKKQFLRENHY